MARFLLIRHGESVWNAEGRWQGQADPPLSDAGRKAARALAERLPTGLVRLVSSDLARSAETATLLGERLGLEPVFDARLREWDVGDWSGLPHDEIVRRHPDEYRRVRAGDLTLRPGGGESRAELRERVLAALDDYGRRGPAGTVGVVTHGGVIRTLIPDARIENLEWTPFELGVEVEPRRSAG